MRWKGERQSENVEDRRGMPGTVMLGGGMGTLILIVIALLLGVNPLALLQQAGGPGGPPPMKQGPAGPGQGGAPGKAANDEMSQFVRVVLADTEDVWNEQFRKMGKTYREPKLVLFTGRVESACGLASAAVGPFYCPADEKVYVDLDFFDELRTRFGAKGGDFAQAYVIAHEIGHHVQKQLRTTDRVHRMQGRLSKEEYNQLSVRLELQADFFAGVWAHHAEKSRQMLEDGDIEEAMDAASVIGDDRIQREQQGYVRPESFTHGTSAQRVRWFRKGLQTGDIRQGDTFTTDNL